MANYKQLRQEAIELRKQGYSYNLISQKLDINKSTLSGWLKDVTFGDYHPDVSERVERATHAMTQARIEKSKQARQQAEQEATAEISHFLSDGFSDREIFITGLMLYWGEGTKVGDYVAMTNSDPAIMQIFLGWVVRFLSVTAENFRAEVHIYPDVSVEDAEVYWSESTGIPRTSFYKAQIDKRVDKLIYKQGKLPFGSFHVKVIGVGGKYRQIKVLQWIETFRQYLPQYMRV